MGWLDNSNKPKTQEYRAYAWSWPIINAHRRYTHINKNGYCDDQLHWQTSAIYNQEVNRILKQPVYVRSDLWTAKHLALAAIS